MGTTIIPHHHQPAAAAAAAASQQPKPFFVMDWLEDLLEQAAKKKKNNGTGVLDATTPSALSLPKTPKSSNRSSIDLNDAQEEEESEAPLSRCLPAEMFLPSLRAEDDDGDNNKNINNSRNGDSQKKRDQESQKQQPWQKLTSATSAAATRRPALLPPTLPVKKILMMLLMFLKKPGDDDDDDKVKNKNQKGRSSSSHQPPVPTTAFRATPMSSSFRQRSLDIAEAWTVRGKRAACERADWRTAWVCWNNAYEIHRQLGVGCCELERMREVAASALAVPSYHTDSNFRSIIPAGM